MADAIISVVAVRATAMTEDQIRYQVNLVRGPEKEVLDLSDKLKTIKNVLDDAENSGAKEQSVKSWLKKLEDVAYQLEFILEKLRNSISGKKFLLVLDDVWTEDYKKWEPLKINMKYGALGSNVLVTTRNKGVAKMMGTKHKEIYCSKQLTDEECWMVLRHNTLSGRSEEECGNFEDVGKKIARKCKGLPLAAIGKSFAIQEQFGRVGKCIS